MDIREYTEEEVREHFLKSVRGLVNYWDKIETKDSKEKLESLAFSILSLLDGSQVSLPKFIVAPDPHPDDKDFLEKEGENWYPENHKSNVKCDISGVLHEHWKKLRRNK